MITNIDNRRPVWSPEVTGQEFYYQYHDDDSTEENVVYGYITFTIPKPPVGHSWIHTISGTSATFNIQCLMCGQRVGLYLPKTPFWGYYLYGRPDPTAANPCAEMIMDDVLD